MRSIRSFALAGALVAALGLARETAAQAVPIRDLVRLDRDVPVRLLGYGLVVGLDGTGDRAVAGLGGGQTVRSIANALRQMNITVPPEALRTRNVAAVLVTAEISPYLRPGGRFDVKVGSLGDATSLRGGVLWMTPLIGDVGGDVWATAQGSLVMSDGSINTGSVVPTSGRIPQGGLLEVDPQVPAFETLDRLVLRTPDIAVAQQIADAISASLGTGSAAVEDPGSVRLTLAAGGAGARALALSQIQALTIQPNRPPRVVIDGRDGTVVAGGAITLGAAVVSYDGLTLAIDPTPTPAVDGEVRLAAGTSIQDVAAALYAVGANARALASIFEALRDAGALTAELIVR